MINVSVVHTVRFTNTEFKRILLGLPVNFKGDVIKQCRGLELCMQEFNKLLKAYRYEILYTYEPYKVVCNGFGHLSKVVTESGKVFTAPRVIDKVLEKVGERENVLV